MNRARGYKPLTEQDLTKAYSQYSSVGLKFGLVQKSDSDTVLYDKAKGYVIAWWKKQKADAAAEAAAVKAAAEAEAVKAQPEAAASPASAASAASAAAASRSS